MRRPYVAATTLCLQLAACSTWQPIQQPIPEHLAGKREGSLRLTLAEGRVLEVHYPSIQGDSVIGLRTSGDRLALALQDVTKAEVSRSDGTKTIGAVALGALAVVSIVAVVQYKEACSEPNSWIC